MSDYTAIDPNAEDETVSPDVDHLVICPVCDQVRHKTWFRAGVRGCWACYHHEKLFMAALSEELKRLPPPPITM
jgi:hypothetical protein